MKNLKRFRHFAKSAAVVAVITGLSATVAVAWDAPTLLDDSTSGGGAPVAAQDGKGKVVIVWKHWNGLGFDLYGSQKPAGGQFAAPERISTADTAVGGFDLASNRKGLFTAVWAEDDGIDETIYGADLLPKETAFASGAPISQLGLDWKAPRVALDKKGGTYVAWMPKTGPGVEFATRPAKETYGAAQEIAPAHEANYLSLGASGDGSAVVTWYHWNGMMNDAYAAVLRPKTGLEPLQLISDADGYSPFLTVHPRGGASVFMGTREADLQPGAALFDAPVAFQQLLSPVFRYDKRGNLYAFWTRFAPANKAVLAIRPAGSSTFGPEIEFGDGVDDATAGDVAIDSKGNVRVVWTQFVTGIGAKVQTAYQPAGGAFSTPEDLTDADGYSAQRVFLDKKGRATVVYQEFGGSLWATAQTN